MPNQTPNSKAVSGTPLRYCPACGALAIRGRTRCLSCNLDFTKAGATPGARPLNMRPDKAPEYGGWVRGAKWAGGAVAVLALAFGVYSLATGRKKNQAWKKYPTSRTFLVKRFFGYVSTDTNADFAKAYKLLALSRRHAKNAHPGQYYQRFHDLDQYLAGEFGPQWINRLKVIRKQHAVNGKLKTQLVAVVDTERFHVFVTPQVPKGFHPGGPRHYGLQAIREFQFHGGAASQRMGIINSYVGGFYGATGSANQIRGLSAAFGGSDANETPWQIKQRLLPIVEDPHGTALRQCIYQLWPVRTDPTVRRRLYKIIHDPRYAPNIRTDARSVYNGTASAAILIGNGVTKVH